MTHLVAFVMVLLALAPPSASASNPVLAENALPGSANWVASDLSSSGLIEAYTSEVSAAPGGVIHLHVSTAPSAPYRIDVYRLGWYGGDGGRLVACLPSCQPDSSEQGYQRPVPAPDLTTGELDAGWPVTDTLTIGWNWVSGYYEARLSLMGPLNYEEALVPFIVTAPPGNHSAILVQVPVNTWEAYNPWGGKSLYDYNSTGNAQAVKVSFNRPYVDYGQSMFSYELQFIRFLEREGYDVSYTTDADVDADPSQLLAHRLVIVNGHDEYRTATQRDAFEQARSAGVNLAFFGSDIGWWQARYQGGRRTLVEYRSARLDPENSVDPELDTVAFQDLEPTPRPPCELQGVQWLLGSLEPQSGPAWPYDPAASALGNPWFSGTGITGSSSLPDVVGYEWDSTVPGCATPPLTNYFTGSIPSKPAAAMVSYTATSGARVFSSGDVEFNWLLDDYGRPNLVNRSAQRFATNLINDLIGSPLDAVLPDLTSPPRPLISGGPSGPSESTSASFGVEGQPGAQLVCRLDDSLFQSCAGASTYAELPLGRHTFEAEQINTAGNIGPPVAFSWDSSPPPLEIEPPPLEVRIESARARVVGRLARVDLGCTGGAPGSVCRGTLSLRLRENRRVARRVHGRRRTVTIWVTVMLSRVRYSVAAAAHRLIGLRLNHAALVRLAQARGHRLRVQAKATLLEGRTRIREIILRRAKLALTSPSAR